MIHTLALLLRSRLESTRSRTVERGVLQLQALVDQFGCDDSTAEERSVWLYALDMPSKWEMEVGFLIYNQKMQSRKRNKKKHHSFNLFMRMFCSIGLGVS